MKRILKLTVIMFLLSGSMLLSVSCTKKETQKTSDVQAQEEETESEVHDKGYLLPVNAQDEAEAKEDCIAVMEKIRPIYESAAAGSTTAGTVLSGEILEEMRSTAAETGNPVSGSLLDNMKNHEKMEDFIENSLHGNSGKITVYKVNTEGEIVRRKFTCDGKEMYELYTCAVWGQNQDIVLTESFLNRIQEWKYTEKGWFCYELCVPEPPEVTEVMNGSCMFRVAPHNEEYIQLAKKYLQPLGYHKGNNLLCSEWDEAHMEALDYNGVYEALYAIKYQKTPDEDSMVNGIPKEEFEELITEYLPVSKDKLPSYGTYNADTRTYGWVRLGCGNYIPNDFYSSVPEIVDMQKHKDGTMTLTVEAVCEAMRSDAVIRHELKVRIQKDKIRFLGNRILEDGLKKIPAYQYRVPRENRL